MNGLLKNNGNNTPLKLFAGSIVAIIVLYVIGNFSRQHENPIYKDWYALDILFIMLPVIAIIVGLKLIIINKDKKEIRNAWILFTLAYGAGLLVYIFLWILVPKKK